jgi:hypothetical protein
MRVSSEVRFHRWKHYSWPAAALVASALALSACADQPTAAPSTPAGPAAFELSPDAAVGAKNVRNQVRAVLPIISRRRLPDAAPPSGNVNSPFDLASLGGQVVSSATSWNVYVNCPTGPADCWGTGSLTPATFLHDLNRSSFIRIANQYIGGEAAGHFGVRELSINVPLTGNTATNDDIFGIVISAVSFTNAAGYSNIYHVFLPQGTDYCPDPGFCYSPDNPSTWVFCALHTSGDLPDGRHVLVSVEPYQANAGCAFANQTRVIDATASTLGHEFFETITDPDGGSWFNLLLGFEIGDLCSSFNYQEHLNNRAYVIQTMYSNAAHACTDQP